jgi:phage gp37-like protein
MIETIQDDIITQLEKISGIKSVGVWQGDIDDLLKSPQQLPALAVIYQGADFDEKRNMGENRARHQMDFLIVVIQRNLKSREDGASSAYTIIEAVRNYLIGHWVNPYGYFWPVKEDLLSAGGGFLVYGLSYRMDAALVAAEPAPAP